MTPEEPGSDGVARPVPTKVIGLGALGACVLLSVGVGVGYLLGTPTDRGVEVTDEFTAEITAMNDRSICVAEREDAKGTCGIPVMLEDRDVDVAAVRVGDTATITTMWLVAPNGTRYEAWYVRKP